ncbi:hypothetical protein A3F37_01035 [Candidatus Saccharibacteria bacterium RIFCSPHIGHO2_12_FULL_41_12]|nr:MAG: hypothetical protein A3F37_01035 [Candidatus Saccharibacteria bacterium RIFCSPHIGHO2_12_FULL_41_12]
MKKNENGFSFIGFLLILIIIAILGFVGWYVYKANNDAKNAQKNTSQEAENPSKSIKSKKSAPIDPTKDWTAYSDAKGQFSLKYPVKWVKAERPELCNPGLLLLGANASSVGVCASESFGQVAIASIAGDQRADNKLAAGYNNITSQQVTVDGVVGTRDAGSAFGQQSEIGAVYPNGTKVVKYIFFTAGITYTATYVQGANYPDALSDFDLLVTKTLKFSS